MFYRQMYLQFAKKYVGSLWNLKGYSGIAQNETTNCIKR